MRSQLPLLICDHYFATNGPIHPKLGMCATSCHLPKFCLQCEIILKKWLYFAPHL